MAKSKGKSISDELLAAYLEGNVTPEEAMQVLRAMEHDKQLKELLITAERIDSMLETSEADIQLLPMEQMAAKTKDNLCDFQCEEYLLNQSGIGYNENDLSTEAKANKWLKEKGTPLHSIGRLLENKGLSVIRRYHAGWNDLCTGLDNGQHLIVVVNSDKLEPHSHLAHNPEIDYHAVVVLDIDNEGSTVHLFNPATGNNEDLYPIDSFQEAWADAFCYLVSIAAREKKGYDPHPIDLGDIDLTDDLLELREAIAENAHDVWAEARLREGWKYGPVRNDPRKEHPDLIPYSDLPDTEKQYDRDMAMNTIKLVRKLGYDLIKGTDTELYRALVGKLHQQDNVFHCTCCGAVVFKDQMYCEQCGRKLEFVDFS